MDGPWCVELVCILFQCCWGTVGAVQLWLEALGLVLHPWEVRVLKAALAKLRLVGCHEVW